MKKILLSILAIALTVGTVSASAYALFSDTVNVSGITMTTGNANLGVYDHDNARTEGSKYISVSDPAIGAFFSQKLAAIYPGFDDVTQLWFRNESSSAIDLDLKMNLINPAGNWTELSNEVLVGISEAGGTPTTWYTLDDLKNGFVTFGTPLKKTDDYVRYDLHVKLNNIGNTKANMGLYGNIVFTGTQHQ